MVLYFKNILENFLISDSVDFNLFTLINAVILPTARFRDNTGNAKRKATIKDAEESFTIYLTSINNYEITLNKLVEKYYAAKLTIQPFIIVVGESKYKVESFYVYFNRTLYKTNSYIEAVDLCFKIFFVFKIEYPEVSKGCWTFIQKYFFELTLPMDSKQTT